MNTKSYYTEHFSPDYVRDNPAVIFIESLEDKFEAITNFNIVRGTLKLTQSLCSEQYFLWGGFNSSRLEFECYSQRFKTAAPSGKIRLYITPTTGAKSGAYDRLDNEKTALFTGYIETATPGTVPGYWKVTAYDRIYRVRNNHVTEWLQRFINAGKNAGNHPSWYYIEGAVATTILGMAHASGHPGLPDWTRSIWYPDNKEITTENGIDLLRDFALCCQRFGMLNGNGELEYIQVQDSTTGSECYDVTLYDPNDLSYSDGHVWLPKYFVSEPRTNIFYTTGETTTEEDYYNNFYTIKNSPVLGDQDYINEMYGCDEYGKPSSAYSASNLPAGIFDTARMCLTSGEEYYCQEYKIRALYDPTVPMGSIIRVLRNGNVLVRSYIMERTITFSSTQTIECEMSAQNAPYNAVVPELEAGVLSANAKANEISAKMPFISDGSSLTKLRACKVISKDDYSKLSEKRDDTIYYVYDTGGDNS